MRKFALTVFGLVGTDWVRMTAAAVDAVGVVFVRADGTNSIVPVLPTVFRTSGDVSSVAATLGHRVNMAAVPSVAFPKHAWKSTLTLEEAASKFGCPQIVEQLVASYADEAEAAA